ncbi:MAG: flagellar basal body-associated protein FliL [Candidatus Omnitrophica bacterium]|nr:flagellar basal body-associated protein FliL [Candidatus Omnitrophota bacterium]
MERFLLKIKTIIKLNLFRKTRILFVITVLFLLGTATLAFAKSSQEELSTDDSSPLKDAVILIIRHAEKPTSGVELSPEGEKRAKAYVGYFQRFTIDGKPIKLDYLFATADSAKSHRPRLTITPLSKALGIEIDSRFTNDNFSKLAQEIQNHPHGKNILICWHHGEIPHLLSALGVDPEKLIPNAKWPEDVFGWLIQLRYDKNGQLFDIKRIDENLLPDDLNKDTLAAP